MNKIKTDFIKGIIIPIVIPVAEDEHVDEKLLRKHVDFVIEGGVDGILAFGSNGEFYAFDEEEMHAILDIIVSQVAGRIPVYMGIGAISTKKCMRLARYGVEHGCSGVSILQPMFLKPSDDELFSHFSEIASCVPDHPVLLYNNPGRTGYPLGQDLVGRLAHEIENIVGMKDSSGDMTQTEEFIRRNSDVGFKVLCGKDTLIYSGLCVGCVGAVCSTANFLPELVCSIYNLFEGGEYEESLKAQFVLNPIRLQMDKSSFPVATKDYCNLLGHCVGLPLKPSKCSTTQQLSGLKARLVEAGILK